jgi:hypothetical protein
VGTARQGARTASSGRYPGELWVWLFHDVSELDKGDFSELEARGLNPFDLKKLKRWCEAGVATEMLPSSSTVHHQHLPVP